MRCLRGAEYVLIYQISDQPVDWMEIFVSPSIRSIVFMMYLMILVEIWQVEQFVAPESKKIFNVVNYEYYLKKDLAEIWEIVKAKFCSLYHRNVECYRKYNQLIKDQLFYYSSQLILPIFPLPWP